MLKRLFDLITSGTALILLSPFMVFIAIAILADSGRPIFYRQQRVGRNGRTFRILKFRSMVEGADAHGKLTVSGDLRITRIGRLLRHYKLDELPQLVNVFLGDMSLVGPRPEVPEFVAHYSDADKEVVLSVRPGITDNASIEFKDENLLLEGDDDPRRRYIEEILPAKIALYRSYVSNQSFGGDISILLRTVSAIWLRSN